MFSDYNFSDLFRIFLAFIGLVVFYTEFVQAADKVSPDDADSASDYGILAFLGPFWLLIIRAPWYALSGILVLEAITFQTNNDTLSNSFLLYGGSITIAILRLIYLRLTIFRTNKHKLLVRSGPYMLRGETGIVIKEVFPTTIGIVRMDNPVFENDEVECIADEHIAVGTHVKVLEIDCNLLKIARKTNFPS